MSKCCMISLDRQITGAWCSHSRALEHFQNFEYLDMQNYVSSWYYEKCSVLSKTLDGHNIYKFE